MVRLDCAINHQLHSLCASPSIIKASFFALYEMTCDFKARVNPQVARTCNLNGVAGFKEKAELDKAKVGAKVEPNTP